MPLQRSERVVFLASKLWESFLAEDSGRRVALTGDIIPHGSLRSKHIRSRLAWAESLSDRFVTFSVAKRAIIHLERKYYLNYPVIPGVTVQKWRETQASRIVALCYRMKKNCKARQKIKSATAMDSMEDTLAYDGEAPAGSVCPLRV